jgi:predicted oxidoreductase
MTTQRIGETDLTSSRLSYGCMRIAGTWNPAEVDDEKRAAAHLALETAFEHSYTLFDHADIYARGASESLHGELLGAEPSKRDKIVIATKCGIKPPGQYGENSPHTYDFSASHILWSCDRSLERLQTDYIDIYQLHRPDYLMNPEEVAEAFTRLKEQGKVRHFGVSNFLPDKVSLLQKYVPLCVNQVEISLSHRDPLEDGTLNQCMQESITPLSWSPLAGGALGEGAEGELIALTDQIAEAHGVTRTDIALAWLLKHPSGIIPIIGTTKPERIIQSTKAAKIELSREDWYRLFTAAVGEPMP